MSSTTTRARLEAIAGPGASTLTIEQLVEALGIEGEYAVQSVRNRISGGTFPIPSEVIEKHRVFDIGAVVDFLDGDGTL
ncbi:TPA: hypothetical protein ACU9T0_006655 [Burkholderia cenocepacia]